MRVLLLWSFWIQLGCQKWLTLQTFSLAEVPLSRNIYSSWSVIRWTISRCLWFFLVLDSESYSKHCSGATSPSLKLCHPLLNQDLLINSQSTPQNLQILPLNPYVSSVSTSTTLCVLYVGSFSLYVSPYRACAVSPGTLLPLFYIFFNLGLKSLTELPLTTIDH